MKKLSIRTGTACIWDSVKLWWADWSNQLLVSLAAILLSLTILLYPVALFGVFYEALDLTHDLRSGIGGFWLGMKRHFKAALLWGLVNTIGVVVFGFSIWFYSNSSFYFAPLFVWMSILALAFWLTWQLLSVACFFLQEPQTLKLAWRNGAVLLLNHPTFLLPINIFLLAMLFLSVRYFIPLVAGSEALIALLCLRSVQTIVKSKTPEK